ncbi:hypothetical protein GGI21_004539 [Coemansia aciculifera]|nr:hypothetical protein GGI21_004539 [Coemansia aciculifera]
MSDSEGPFACACLNLRIHTNTTSGERTALEEITDVLACELDSMAIQVELRSLFEVKPGSSIDPSISVVRCLLCKQPVLYFKPIHPSSVSSTQPRQLPPPYSPAYLAKEAKDPKTVRENMKMSEYSELFNVLLLPAFIGSGMSAATATPTTTPLSSRGTSHVPRDIKQKASEFLQLKEAAKNERIHEFVRAQDQALEQVRRRAMDECNIIAGIVSQAQSPPHALDSQDSGPSSMRRDSIGASSGLASLLRGRAHSNVGSLPVATIGGRMANPFERTAGSSKYGHNQSDDDDGQINLDDYDDDGNPVLRDGLQAVANATASPAGFRHVSSGGAFGRGLGSGGSGNRRRSSSRQSDDYSDEFESDEPSFGNFDNTSAAHQSAGLNMSAAAAAAHQQQDGNGKASGNLSQLLTGSMPRQIPPYGSSSFAGIHSLNRREYQQRADEKEMSRRRDQMVRGLPKTFVPPHQLMDRIHESGNSTDLLIGSKPRDSHAIGRRHAPG